MNRNRFNANPLPSLKSTIKVLLSCGLAMIIWPTSFLFGQAFPDTAARELQSWLDESREKADVPAAFAGVVRDQQPPIIVASGVRKFGESTAVTAQDRLHLGSCTKALTSLLIARLVDQGKLSWDQPLRQQAPRLATAIHSDYESVTLRQLLSHRGSVPANAKDWWLNAQNKNINTIRRAVAKDSLDKSPAHAIGSKYQYSNLGYMLAGLVASEVTNMSWEELMQQEVFTPLQLTTAGFGPPGKNVKSRDNEITEPWGHAFNRTWQPTQHDNAPALGPAGTVHMSGDDWCRVAQYFIQGAANDYLSPTQYEQLITPVGNQYALGWIAVKRPWAEGIALTHAGSNTYWYCVIWIAPQTKRAYFVATNSSRDNTPQTCDEWIGQLIDWESQLK